MEQIDILCVEDNKDFGFFITKAFEKLQNNLNYTIAETGEEAIEKLKISPSVKPPKLIFLDIDLPDFNGFEILKKVRDNQFLKHTPVIMLSSSEHPKDVESAYKLGANAYVTKPTSFKKIIEILDDSCKFWLKHNFHSN